MFRLNTEEENIITKIEECWDGIGLSEDDLRSRFDMFRKAFHTSTLSVLSYGLQAQQEYHTALQNSIDNSKNELINLEHRLGVTSDRNDEKTGEMKLFELEKYYREERLQPLLTLKENRRKMLERLLDENHSYVTSLGVESFHIPDPTLRYRLDVLDRLAAVNDSHLTVSNDRKSIMAARRARITTIAKDLKLDISHVDFSDITGHNMALTESLEKEMVEKKQAAEELGQSLLDRIIYLSKRMEVQSDVSVQSPDIIHRLFDPDLVGKLRNEVLRMEREVAAQMENMIGKHRERIKQLWEVMHIPAEERDFPALFSVEFSEDTLRVHEEMRKQLEDFFDDHRQIFDLIEERKELTMNKVQLEERERDPVVMQNRGGILLKTQAEKKKVLKQLEKNVAELRAAIKKKEDSTKKSFLIGTMTLDEFLAKEKVVVAAEKVARMNSASAAKRKEGKGTPLSKRLKTENENLNRSNRGCDSVKRELTFGSSSGKIFSPKRKF
ncbi:protein regulator of cytokinesis 1-like isoform X2 [Paramacrobiotus metropolitanus]|nr:protein regulator of cytokinesis 1-like isoform X2 [Paramacrobiotus metropolitanus]XP_055342204.1 protein regulator of cytokinesis 1-like isoform X2 [Paramacrobiotus metropolitanus]